MNRTLILGLLTMATVSATFALPVSAHEGDRYGRSGYDRNDGGRYSGSGYGYGYSRRDNEHDREHSKLDRKHDQAHRRGFDGRRDHERWHEKAGRHHDGDHHRIYGEHAPNRRFYYSDRRDDYRYDRYRR